MKILTCIWLFFTPVLEWLHYPGTSVNPILVKPTDLPIQLREYHYYKFVNGGDTTTFKLGVSVKVETVVWNRTPQ